MVVKPMSLINQLDSRNHSVGEVSRLKCPNLQIVSSGNIESHVLIGPNAKGDLVQGLRVAGVLHIRLEREADAVSAQISE